RRISEPVPERSYGGSLWRVCGSRRLRGSLLVAIRTKAPILQTPSEQISCTDCQNVRRASRAATEVLLLARAAGRTDAAGLGEKAAINEQQIADLKPALEREVRDRRSLQTQADLAREAHHAANERAAKASASSFREELRREDVEAEIAQLRREIGTLKARKRRWWWPG